MKKLGYLISLALTILLPNICCAENLGLKTMSDIEFIYNSTTEGNRVTLKLTALVDFDYNKENYIDIWGEDSNGTYYHVFTGNGDFKLGLNGSCDNTAEITNDKIEKDSVICASKDLSAGTTLNTKVSFGTQYYDNDNLYSEEFTYDIESKSVSQIRIIDFTYQNEMLEKIKKHYNGYVDGGCAGDENGYIYSFIYDRNKERCDLSNEVMLGEYLRWDYTKDLKYYTDILDKYIEQAGIKFETKIENSKIESGLLGGIKTAKKVVEYETKEDNKLLYSWTFDGTQMEETDYDINLEIKIDSGENKDKINDLVENENVLNLDFTYSGKLPKGTKVTINVSDKFKDGEKVTLYYYNPETDSLEKIAEDLVVENGCVTFYLEHCSEYVLTSESNNAQTSSMNVAFYIILLFVSSLGLYLIKREKKVN